MYLNLIGYSSMLILLTMFYLKKPHYLKLILVISYGLLYLVHCINLINDLVFNYKHFIIGLVNIAILYSYYKFDKIGKDNSPT